MGGDHDQICFLFRGELSDDVMGSARTHGSRTLEAAFSQ